MDIIDKAWMGFARYTHPVTPAVFFLLPHNPAVNFAVHGYGLIYSRLPVRSNHTGGSFIILSRLLHLKLYRLFQNTDFRKRFLGRSHAHFLNYME